MKTPKHSLRKIVMMTVSKPYTEMTVKPSAKIGDEQNLLEKFNDASFLEDVVPLLIASSGFDFREAKDLLMNRLLPMIPGEPWQGRARE